MNGRQESRMIEAIESLTEAVECNTARLAGLLALAERKLGSGAKVFEITARQERELEGRPVIELVNPKKPGPA